jgi:carbamoyl-phosphate synthase large subunit
VPIPATHSIRTFTAATPNAATRLQIQTRASLQKRSFLTTARCLASTQSPLNPQAYLESGVVKPKQSVDVKKVLVIGSGGLAIGQAGEFDYSGLSFPTNTHPLGGCEALADESHYVRWETVNTD